MTTVLESNDLVNMYTLCLIIMLKNKSLVNSKRHKTGKISFVRSLTVFRKNRNVDLNLATVVCLAFPRLLNRLETLSFYQHDANAFCVSKS